MPDSATSTSLEIGAFDYLLPKELIAQRPAPIRDQSRLLVHDRCLGTTVHRHFFELPSLLRRGDLLVLNDTRVVPARLRGVTGRSMTSMEVLLLEPLSSRRHWVMLRPGRRVQPGSTIQIIDRERRPANLSLTVLEKNLEGHFRVEFSETKNLLPMLIDLGEMPLPPYIHRLPPGDRMDFERYQTVFAMVPGSCAAPTAGLHFTPELLASLRKKGVKHTRLTLHVGLGTFAPVKVRQVTEHVMHEESFSVPAATARLVAEAKAKDRRVIAVGTTALRALESAFLQAGGEISAESGKTDLFVLPPFHFRIAGGLITNFHLPKSTLMMLVSAFLSPGKRDGIDPTRRLYAEAMRRGYRFFSYGDAMLIL